MPVIEALNTDILSQFDLQIGDAVSVEGAHPDDDATRAALIRAMKEAGLNVHVRTATLGKHSTKGDPDFVQGGGRLDEFGNAMELLRIPPENQHHCNHPDGQLRHLRDDLAKETEEFGREHKIAAFILIGEVADDHPDHTAVDESTVIAATNLFDEGQGVSVWELSWLHNGDVFVPFNAAEIKDPVIDIYRSQFGNPEDRAELAKYGSAMTSIEAYRQIPLLGATALY